MSEVFGGMLSGLSLPGSETFSGIDGWIGIATLIVSIVVAVLTFAERSGVLPYPRRPVLMANVGLSLAAVALVLFGLSRLGGMVSVEYGLVFAALSVVGAAVLAFRRSRACGRLQPTDQ